MRNLSLCSVGIVLALGACNPSGNLHADNTYQGSPSKEIKHPQYDPYMGPGDAPVTWISPTFNRNGMIVAPRDPAQERDWEYYQNSPWFNDGTTGPKRPAGTY